MLEGAVITPLAESSEPITTVDDPVRQLSSGVRDDRERGRNNKVRGADNTALRISRVLVSAQLARSAVDNA